MYRNSIFGDFRENGPVASAQSPQTRGRRPSQIVAECEVKSVSEKFHKGQKDRIEEMRWLMRHWPRRYREESRGKRGVTMLQQQYLNQNQQHLQHLRESPIETEFQEKIACDVSIVNSQRQWTAKCEEPVTDTESRMQTGDPLEMGTGESMTVSKHPTKNCSDVRPEAVTTQEAVDGYREKTMRIASVEQVDLGNIMELSITDHVLEWARRWKLSGGADSLGKAGGWNLKNHSHLTVTRHLLEKTQPSILVVTIREGEERRICSAALKEVLKIVEDEIQERSVVVFVLNKESAIWKGASMNTLSRDDQLKYIGFEGMRVATNHRCAAEQIKSDKVENVAMGGSKHGEFGKLENQRIPELPRRGKIRTNKKLCESIIKDLARRNREKHAMLEEIEAEQ